MKRWTHEDLTTKPCAALNGHVLKLEPLRERPLKQPAAVMESEGELQRKCEEYLVSHDFLRLTAKHAGRPARGWFGHLHKPEGNPFLPDLFIFHEPNDRPALLIELKTKAQFQPGQKAMINRGAWQLCWSFAEFATAFSKWLKGGRR
jgi:hypothetical protein